MEGRQSLSQSGLPLLPGLLGAQVFLGQRALESVCLAMSPGPSQHRSGSGLGDWRLVVLLSWGQGCTGDQMARRMGHGCWACGQEWREGQQVANRTLAGAQTPKMPESGLGLGTS